MQIPPCAPAAAPARLLLHYSTWFGVVSSFCYVMFGILLLTWHHEPLDELPATMQLSVAAAPEGVTV